MSGDAKAKAGWMVAGSLSGAALMLFGTMLLTAWRDRVGVEHEQTATAEQVRALSTRVEGVEGAVKEKVGAPEFAQFEKRVDQQFAEVKAQLTEVKQLLKRRGQ